MGKSFVLAVIGGFMGTAVGIVIGSVARQTGDTSTMTYVGPGIIAMLGAGLGAVAGAIVGTTGAIIDVLNRKPGP